MSDDIAEFIISLLCLGFFCLIQLALNSIVDRGTRVTADFATGWFTCAAVAFGAAMIKELRKAR